MIITVNLLKSNINNIIKTLLNTSLDLGLLTGYVCYFTWLSFTCMPYTEY